MDCLCNGPGACDDGPGCIAALAFIAVLGLAYGLYYVAAMLWGGAKTWTQWRTSPALWWSTIALAAAIAGCLYWLMDAPPQ